MTLHDFAHEDTHAHPADWKALRWRKFWARAHDYCRARGIEPHALRPSRHDDMLGTLIAEIGRTDNASRMEELLEKVGRAYRLIVDAQP